jgi:hypothetical protein
LRSSSYHDPAPSAGISPNEKKGRSSRRKNGLVLAWRQAVYSSIFSPGGIIIMEEIMMTPIPALTAIMLLSKIYPIPLVNSESEKNFHSGRKCIKIEIYGDLGLTIDFSLFNNRAIMDRSFQVGIIIIISSIIIPGRGAEEV